MIRRRRLPSAVFEPAITPGLRRFALVAGAVAWIASAGYGVHAQNPGASTQSFAPAGNSAPLQNDKREDRPPAPAVSHVDPGEQYAAVVKQYCVTCHNDRAKTADFSLQQLDVTHPAAAAEAWEKVIRKLRRGAMPPEGVRRPDKTTYEGLLTYLETELDRAAVAHPNPGRPLPHRFNRAEYANAIKDLLALDVGDVAALLPADDSAFGFDNIAEALGASSVLLERYVTAAGRISALAVGDPEVAAGSDTFVLRQDYSQDQHVEGQPFGTVGGLVAQYTFPLDAEYELSATLMRTNVDATRGVEDPRQLEFTIDGERVFLTALGGGALTGLPGQEANNANRPRLSRSDAIDAQLRVRVKVKAGPRAVGVDFLQRSLGENTRKLQPFRSSFDSYDASGMPHIRTLSVTGPFNPSGPGDTPSRRRIFVCRPANASTEETCAREILSTLARRAYRQPPHAADVDRLLDFYRAGRSAGTFDTGIERALQRVLASPKFFIRVEQEPSNIAAGAVYPVSDYELASRLSFFLLSSIPDDVLIDLAGQGRLRTPDVLERQVRRMLADPKADRLVENFAGQWLQLRNLRNSVPNEDLFPAFDDNLRQSFQRETELFFGSIVREDRSALDLLTADYTFVNERLAKHYRIPNVYGSQFRRVTVTDEARRGLFGQGSILTSTSNANRTSPTVRGKWILANLIGMPPSPPPPNVPPLKENAEGDAPKNIRAMMEEHRANPVCASCHKLMDPLGFSLENFDAVGAWRTRDNGSAIDASGRFLDGTTLNGVTGLRQALVQHPDIFVGTLTEKLLTYALGRGLDAYDMPAARAILRGAAAHHYRFSALVLGIVRSTPFLERVKGADGETTVGTAH
jgi:mono/diheme cytochrome c family protein